MYVITSKHYNYEVIPSVSVFFPHFQKFHHNRMCVWQSCLWALCTNMANSANANCRPIIWTSHATHVPLVLVQINVRWLGLGWAGLTDLTSVERQFLLIWLNQWRQMQPIHSSGNLWILRWALTYIAMTSKHIFSIHLLPALSISSLLCPAHPRCRMGAESHICANKIN